MNTYYVETLLWSTTDEDKEEYETLTFEVKATDEKAAWGVAGDYMYNNYKQELYDADTTITEVR